MPQALSLTVALPERGSSRPASGFSGGKPMASVSMELETGERRDIVVPLRVGRLLRDEAPSFPCDVDETFASIHALEERVCFSVLTEILGRRDHSAFEMREKLRGYGYRAQEVEACIERAQELRYLDDARFSCYFIEERKRRGWGRRKIEQELKRKGVSIEDVPGYPEAFFSEDEDAERALALLARKSVPEGHAFEKLVRYLMAKGFSYGVAAGAVRARLTPQEGETCE